MNLNGILIGSEDPQRLTEYYTRLFGQPGWSGGDFVGWQLGSGYVTVGPHDRCRAPTSARPADLEAVDHDIATGVWPDMTTHGWATDAWSAIYLQVLAADILVLCGPI